MNNFKERIDEFEERITKNQCIECMSPCIGYAFLVEEHDVWACPYCGKIGGEEQLYRDRNLLSGDISEEFVVINGAVSLREVRIGPMLLLECPYEAKEDLKKLPFRDSERRWMKEYQKWAIRLSWRKRFIEHMRDNGWKVIDLYSIRQKEVLSNG